eukprot:TRINITY_DN1937_c0_g1_i1.p1 TRINITY_DN1937_c0_g1~~TRINITY_DN1937_c0_g1_i1.p1  ORF type:complete len:484 (+),score=107.19 TRINITY_DN1937_c0_g1_i1:61-1452(+)
MEDDIIARLFGLDACQDDSFWSNPAVPALGIDLLRHDSLESFGSLTSAKRPAEALCVVDTPSAPPSKRARIAPVVLPSSPSGSATPSLQSTISASETDAAVAEFLASRQSIAERCRAQEADFAAGFSPFGISLRHQPPQPVVVRSYNKREPHFAHPFVLQVNTGDCALAGPVRAVVVTETFEVVATPAGALAEVDPATGTATFSALRVDSSKKTARLFVLFIACVDVRGTPTCLATLSHPLVCITNSAQLAPAEAALLWFQYQLPERQGSAPWAAVCASIVDYFQHTCLAVQTPGLPTPLRPLSDSDIDFIASLVQRNHELTWTAFSNIWLWFSAVCDSIRRRIQQRWVTAVNGHWLVAGFVDRDQAAAMLSGKPPGSFVVRWSSQLDKGGSLVVSQVGGSGVVEHKLVDNRYFEAGRNLDDILLVDFPALKFLLVGESLFLREQVLLQPTRIANRHPPGPYA